MCPNCPCNLSFQPVGLWSDAIYKDRCNPSLIFLTYPTRFASYCNVVTRCKDTLHGFCAHLSDCFLKNNNYFASYRLFYLSNGSKWHVSLWYGTWIYVWFYSYSSPLLSSINNIFQYSFYKGILSWMARIVIIIN